MTNNTIPNVPRELLADLLGNDHDKRIMAERHLLAMLANAPSPAGVDGLKRYEVFPYLDDDVAELDICESDDGTFVKYDDAQAIIDGLRARCFSLVMNCAAELETASYCMTDEEAKRIAQSGADYYRKEARLSAGKEGE